MAQEPFRHLLRRLRHVTDPSRTGALADAQLLDRFVNYRDEAAFEVLVWRHGPMVFNVCRRLLRHEHDAEDAFQATFLALVRKAGSIAKREALAAWLYKVAYRVALAARTVPLNTIPRQLAAADTQLAAPAEELIANDLRPVLDEEVNRLPEKYRTVFVLCHLEGNTNEEAARQLGCPKGTVLSRLSRARARLRARLTRRGIGLTAGLLATAAEPGSAALPAALIDLTLNSALPGAAGQSAASLVSSHVAALTQGVLRAMFMTKLKTTVSICLALCLAAGGLGLGATWWINSADAGEQPATATIEALAGPAAAPPVARPALEPEDPVKAAARRAKSQTNLKMIGLAMHNYHDVNGSFPAPALYARDGKPLLSWRVAILPYLDQHNLYKRFHLDESWDSPHNKTLLPEMPTVYAPVGALFKEPDATYYQAFVGKGASFEPQRRFRLGEFQDGTSNTLLVVEAAAPVPWTKPEDLPFVPDQALPKLGGLFDGDFNALFGDGSAHFLSKNADQDMLRAAITPAGGEIVDFDKLHAFDGTKPGRARAADVEQANLQLKEALQATFEETARLKDDVNQLKAKLNQNDARTAKMLAENADLKQALARAIAELEALKAEKARLEKELTKPSHGRK
jgi:RNA polymerase sigma factor (sigma-70 family)